MDLDISIYLKLGEQNEHGQNKQSIAGPMILECEARNKLLNCNAGSITRKHKSTSNCIFFELFNFMIMFTLTYT